LKVVVCSVNDWANLGYTVGKAFRSIGLDCESYTLFKHPFGYKESSQRLYIEELKDKIREADTVIVMHSGEKLLWDYEDDKLIAIKEMFDILHGKQLIIHHGGTAYTKYYESINNIIHPRCDLVWVQNNSFANKKGTRREVLCYPPFDVGELSFDDVYHNMKILHTPSNPEKKGTNIIQTRDDITIDLEILHYDENIERIKGCDVYIDQIGTGAFGMVSLEAASMGKIVISSLEGDYPHGECGILVANNKKELDETIDWLHTLPQNELHDLKRKTYDWVNNTHNLQIFANDMYKYLKKRSKAMIADKAYILYLEEDKKKRMEQRLEGFPIPYEFIRGPDGRKEDFADWLKDNDYELMKDYIVSEKEYEEMNDRINSHMDNWWSKGITTGEAGCGLGHWYMWKKAQEDKVDRALFLEDDALLNGSMTLKNTENGPIVDYFDDDMQLLNIVKSLEYTEDIDWDLMYLGFDGRWPDGKWWVRDTPLETPCMEMVSDHVAKVNFAYNLHAYLVTRAGVDILMSNKFEKNLCVADEYIPALYQDEYNYAHPNMKHLNKQLKAYALIPMLIEQEDKSVSNSLTMYTPLIESFK